MAGPVRRLRCLEHAQRGAPRRRPARRRALAGGRVAAGFRGHRGRAAATRRDRRHAVTAHCQRPGGIRPGARRRPGAGVRGAHGRQSRRRQEYAAAADPVPPGDQPAGAVHHRRGKPRAGGGPRPPPGIAAGWSPAHGRDAAGSDPRRAGDRGAAGRGGGLHPGRVQRRTQLGAGQRVAGARVCREPDPGGKGARRRAAAGRPRHQGWHAGGAAGSGTHDRLLDPPRKLRRRALPHAARAEEPLRCRQRAGYFRCAR